MSTLKPRETVVPIYQGDDIGTISDLRQAADVAERIALQAKAKGSPVRLGGDPADDEAQAAKDAYDEFVDQAAERAVLVELRSIGRRRFRDLMAAHPPRTVKVDDDPDEDAPADAPTGQHEETHPDDDSWGVNTETFGDALLKYVDPDDEEIRTVAGPEPLLSRKGLAAFLDDEVAEGDYDGLWVTAYGLNRQPSADPKSSKFSAARRSSTET